MSISYEPLWHMLNELKVTKMEFARMIGMSNATLAKLSKNEPITLTTVDKICNRFDCKIENVVKHIPDIKISKAKFLVDKGMIVLMEDFLSKEVIEGTTTSFRIKERPHVVLDIVSPEMDNDPKKIKEANYDDLSYAVAPIFIHMPTSVNSPLDIKFTDVEIDGVTTSGIVSFGRLSLVDSGLFKKKLGTMPKQYMIRFDKMLRTLDDVVEVVDED